MSASILLNLLILVMFLTWISAPKSVASISISYHPLHPVVGGPDVLQESSLVVIPLLGLAFPRRIFVTAQLQCDLKVIGCQVVEVLHTSSYRIPGSSISNPSLLGKF